MIGGLTIIIPFRDGHATIKRLLDSLPAGLPVIIIDDMSDPPANFQGAGVRTIRMSERGYWAGAINAGIAACTTDVLCLNQDIALDGDGWQTFIAANRDAGIAGNAVRGHPAHVKNYVDGVFMYLSRKALNAVGNLNETDWPLWGGSCELQLRMCRKGFRAVPATIPGLMHERSGAYGSSITQALKDEPSEAKRFIRTPPLVSVVVPCHNYGRYLPDLVHSLVGGSTCLGDHPGQTFAAFELVIVDDASTDDSWQIAQSLADPWQGIHAYRMPANGGTGAAMNYGIERSFGRYIMGLDADDMLEPTAIDSLYSVIEQDEHAVPYHDQQLFADGKRTTKTANNKIVPDIWKMKAYNFEQLLNRNQLPAGIMFARAGWKAAGGYRAEMKWGRQDWAFAVALGQVGYCGVHVPEALYLYRREGQNRTLRNSDAQWRETFVQQMRALFPALYRGDRPMACCGGSRTRPQAQQAPAQGAPRGQMAAMQGAAKQGMVQIEYIGGGGGDTSWWGHSTSMQYRFGPGHPVGYVYESDVEGFLSARKGRQAQFRRYVAPQPVIVATPEPSPFPQLTHIKSLQRPGEAEALQKIALQSPLGYPIVELGTFHGYTAGVLALAGHAPVVTIDDYTERPEQNLPQHIGADAVRKNLAGLDVTVIEGDSRTVPPGITEVGLLYIDSTHTAEQLSAELTAWLPLVVVGGIVAFHDYGGESTPQLKAPIDIAFKGSPAHWQQVGAFHTQIAFKRLTAPIPAGEPGHPGQPEPLPKKPRRSKKSDA